MPELILLVGSNPLPNYLAARALGFKNIRLFYTPETADTKTRLQNCLEKKEFTCENPVLIGDAGDAQKIRRAAQDIRPGAHLHYTGGTKTMVAHIHL